MHELLSHEDIRGIFKPMYYTYIPIEYIYNVEMIKHSGEVKRYTKQQIENKIRQNKNKMHDGYARIADLYNEKDIYSTEINIDFKKIANHINQALVQTLNQHRIYKKGTPEN